jgi:erythromycin esterase
VTSNPLTAPVRLSAEAVIPLRRVDPVGPLDDLAWWTRRSATRGWWRSARARITTASSSSSATACCATWHGFSACAMESGFVEGWLVDGWVRGSQDQLGQVMANGMTSLMGLWTQMRAQLEWIRQHHRTAAHPVGFYGKYPPGDPPPNKPRRHPHRWI